MPSRADAITTHYSFQYFRLCPKQPHSDRHLDSTELQAVNCERCLCIVNEALHLRKAVRIAMKGDSHAEPR